MSTRAPPDVPRNCTDHAAPGIPYLQAAGLTVLGWLLAAAPAFGQSAPDCAAKAADVDADTLLAKLTVCQNQALWLYRLGARLIEEQRYIEAADHLERALLLQPDRPEIQLAYAVALAGSGDVVSALTLLRDVEIRTDLAPSVRAALATAQRRWTALPTDEPREQVRWSAGMRWGHDNNLLGAPNTGSLALTLPGETIFLPLDESSRPKPGAYRRGDARVEWSRLTGSGFRIDASLGLLDRVSPAVPDANTRQADAQLEWSRPAVVSQAGAAMDESRLGWYLGLQNFGLQTDGGTRLYSHGAALGLEWAWQRGTRAGADTSSPLPPAGPSHRCDARAGMDWQSRRLTSNAILSGRYVGVTGTWACQTVAGPARRQQWSVRLGQDTPSDPTRPGGAQRIAGARGTWTQGTIATGAWTLDLDLSHQRDHAGYSALLESGARRHITRLVARLEYLHPLHLVAGHVLALAVGADASVQRSNLALFQTRSWGPFVAIRGSF